MTTITFRGNETTGNVGKIETDRKETTGGVGVRRNNESVFTADNQLKEDTVSFRGGEIAEKKISTGSVILGLTALTALVVGGAGLAHKYDLVGKITNEKAKKFFKHTDAVTEPCHKACAWLKHNTYDPVVKFFKSSK